jgi:peptidoglycan/LPS O-acetylase OafA/YrhL
MDVDVTGLLFFGLIVGVPAVVMMWMSPRWRIACFVLGLILAFGTLALIDSPHDTTAPMIFVGFGIALAALLVEIPAFAIRTLRKRRAAARGEAGDEERPLRFWPRRR